MQEDVLLQIYGPMMKNQRRLGEAARHEVRAYSSGRRDTLAAASSASPSAPVHMNAAAVGGRCQDRQARRVHRVAAGNGSHVLAGQLQRGTHGGRRRAADASK